MDQAQETVVAVKEVARRLQVGETKGIGGVVGLVAPHPGCGWQGEDGLGTGMPYKDTDGLKVDWPWGLLSWGRGGRERGGQLTGCRRWSW